ncbi:ATPase [Candidatus Beckwithbacteria bacterium CG22_combo_CG10-13_8_21_14_all_01_47_9]|uniref:ATPase n=4 Tax=Candidatus Beckwithiibacteriota TaxID=1752726 RepID=A0A2H0E2J1_9BACT|nr:MAG: ATPase [Candidatus Beckwithbacteria bacterium CG23_combo_of_CG06-09_8_20_14_all_47_9]PIP88139.1 MAG: ATPase [Candidatus Beckwithbacteria bacterium CG22_combo_CG10-13_8_21_14_all_01_47_9]PJA21973.1 MAG: ATPase [Candidatus Beckwithbacteria bacterium CG_4_10_14_0_2_um_filter_47_25]PJC66078.1 MAG: ATPase [Candidatus Beckwithbacteria bacterium CG_4_9_14_0_2_um_filter_47_11]
MIQVTKASGQLEALSLDKIRSSLTRAGANEEIIDKILLKLKPKLYDKISTREIYQEVFSSFPRYSLKPALMQLGPSGYPFEKFIGQLFTARGYQTQTRQIIQGKCVSHEVDVVAEKPGQRLVIECKFHNRPGTKTEIKDALYTQARFEDIAAAAPGKYAQIWLVTNTQLTSQAIAYGRCKNMGLLAWRYPAGESIEKLIDRFNLYYFLKLGYSEK